MLFSKSPPPLEGGLVSVLDGIPQALIRFVPRRHVLAHRVVGPRAAADDDHEHEKH